MLKSHCSCGNAKDPSEYGNPYCSACTTLGNEVYQHAIAEGKTESQALYDRRMAITSRAVKPSSGFVNPRTFSDQRGLIPVPPQSGDRGGPAA